jgi:hypothetical protein
MVREELDDIDESVGRGDTLSGGRTTRSDGGEEEDGGVFRLPGGCGRGGVLLEVDANVLSDDAGDLRLELLHQRLGEVGSGLTTGFRACERGCQHHHILFERGEGTGGSLDALALSKSLLTYSAGSSSNNSSSNVLKVMLGKTIFSQNASSVCWFSKRER